MSSRTTALAAVAAALVASVAVAAPASALTRSCSSAARMCIHYNSVANGMNAEFGSDYNVPSFNPSNTTNDIFFKAGSEGSAGAGEWVWNNAASLVNFHMAVKVAVFVNSSYDGERDIFYKYTGGNLVKTKNDNASMAWGN